MDKERIGLEQEEPSITFRGTLNLTAGSKNTIGWKLKPKDAEANYEFSIGEVKVYKAVPETPCPYSVSREKCINSFIREFAESDLTLSQILSKAIDVGFDLGYEEATDYYESELITAEDE